MYRTAYCSNVHAGSDLRETRSNLESFACRVKELVSPDEPMGIGLWLSAQSARDLLGAERERVEFAEFLTNSGLDPWTFNGFPFGNFHQPVVKKDVYQPTWCDPSRLAYTRDLVALISQFASSPYASISTLPLDWGTPKLSDERLTVAASQLQQLAVELHQKEQETGKLVSICIEPEPGCVIEYGRDIVDFFENHLLRKELVTGATESVVRRHLRVCHDVCHAVVMCESQADVLKTYHAAGIEVGKVQISSAIEIDFDTIAASDRHQAIKQLSSFAEDRYLHQTTVQTKDGNVTFFEDLPPALAKVTDDSPPQGIWRIHFHVPVFLSEFGYLRASQPAIEECLACCREYSNVEHFEVETYAWNVLPTDLQQADLAVGIAEEMKWFSDRAAAHLGT